jgi:RNA polymerase sigma-70 factor (ECF subfamily)
LLERFRRGEESAFEQLYIKYREAVYSAAWKVLHDSEGALDVVQDTFLRAYKGAADFRGDSGFYSWLRRIAINLAIDRLRSDRSGDAELKEETLSEEKCAASAARLGEESPAAKAAGQELAVAMQDALGELGAEHRTALLLHAQEGMSYREIADAMKCPIGTVMSRLYYARQKLGDKLRRFLGHAR